ncbi:MAG: hypothetical protein M3O31_05365, partial [Acidobacteriota bacterium]|nr:hypothetical protein [Acidobacteriota bacterium]
MGLGWYGKWMTRWETALTTRDTNRIVRPLEWGFEWLQDFGSGVAASEKVPQGLKPDPVQELYGTGQPVLTIRTGSLQEAGASAATAVLALTEPEGVAEPADIDRMIALNEDIARRSDDFFGYVTPTDFRLEERHPALFPTNVRPETLAQDAEMKRQAAAGELATAQFLRFTSPVRTRYAENDSVNARWYPAAPEKQKPGQPRQALIVMPQWNADAISHNALCSIANWLGVSALRLSKPYHDIRRPAEIERSDYAMSANVGRTISACRQAVADIRSCMDWLETQGYTQ